MPLLPRQSRSFLQIEPLDTFTYTYNLFTGKAHLQIIILVESEPDRPNHYTFSLSIKVGDVERGISKPVTMRLSIDPRALDFVVFAFPPRSGLPSGCLYHLRIWLRTPGADHRLFAEKDLWFGRDPDFHAIPEASFASLRNSTHDTWVYQGPVGGARVTFILRHRLVEPGIYALSLDYEAGGAGKTLFDNYHLRLYCEPHAVSYSIYTIPVTSKPIGASHRLRVWVRTTHRALSSSSSSSSSRAHPPHGSYLYHRLWKSDDFKIGAHLGFDTVGNTIVLGTRAPTSGPSLMFSSVASSDEYGPLGANTNRGRNMTYFDPRVALTPNRRRVSRLAPSVSAADADESINDR